MSLEYFSNNFISYAGIFSLIAWVILRLPLVRKVKYFKRVLVILAVALFSFYVPLWHGASLVCLLRGILGDLSVSTLLVLAYILIWEVFSGDIFPRSNPLLTRLTSLLILICGSLLYLSVFGVINPYLYGYAYHPFFMLILFLGLEIFLLFKNRLFFLVWLAALIAFYFKLQTSINFWDYLLDPVLCLIALYYLF